MVVGVSAGSQLGATAQALDVGAQTRFKREKAVFCCRNSWLRLQSEALGGKVRGKAGACARSVALRISALDDVRLAFGKVFDVYRRDALLRILTGCVS